MKINAVLLILFFPLLSFTQGNHNPFQSRHQVGMSEHSFLHRVNKSPDLPARRLQQKENFSQKQHLRNRTTFDFRLDSATFLRPINGSGQFGTEYKYTFNYGSNGLLAEEISETTSDLTGQWDYSWRTISTYDEANRLIRDEYMDWNAIFQYWENDRIGHYTYNDLDLVVTETYFRWDEYTLNWRGLSRDSFTYDQAGLLANNIYSRWNYELENWSPFAKSEYIYNEEGKLISITFFLDESGLGQWLPISKQAYDYNEEGRLESETAYDFSHSAGWEQTAKSELSYDQSGNLASEIFSAWNNIQKVWTNNEMDVYTYNENNLELSWHSFTWDNTLQLWSGNWGDLLLYNEFGDIIENVSVRWDPDSNEWIEPYKTLTNYNTEIHFDQVQWPSKEENPYLQFNRMPVSIVYYDNFGEWLISDSIVLHYNVITSAEQIVREVDALFAPVPASDLIRLNASEIAAAGNLTLYDLNGRISLQVDVTDEQGISIDHLPSGLYVYHFRTAQEVLTGKLIVQR